MRIIFMGTPDFALPSLQALIDSKHDVVGVVTQPDRARGRGLKLTATPVKLLAKETGIPVLQPERFKTPAFRESLRAWEADLFVVVAFRILPISVSSIPPEGAINLHASLLPKYRGAAPIQWAIVNGEAETGVTTFFIEQKVDTGSILRQERIAIGPDETAGELYERLMTKGAQVLEETVEMIAAGEAQPIPQRGEATSAPKLTKTDGLINWSVSTEAIHNRIRGLNPVPMAYTYRDGRSLRVIGSRRCIDRPKSPGRPGEVVAVDSDQGLIIRTGDGLLALTIVQPDGKKRMTADEYVRGYHIKPGDRLTSEQRS